MTSDKRKDNVLNFFNITCLLLVACCLLLSAVACGTKAPPSLKAYEKPGAPVTLAAQHREDKIILTWTYPDNLRRDLKGFIILRSEAEGFARIGFAKKDESSFNDSAFKLNTAYAYKVIAQSLKDVAGKDSDIVKARPLPLPLPPEEIKAGIKADSVEITWQASGEGVCYNIYKSTEKGKYGSVPQNKLPVCEGLFKDSVVVTGPVYYTIRALHNTDIWDEGYVSKELEINPADFIPAVPSDLRVVAGDSRIYLIWKESAESWVSGYRVYRKAHGDAEFKLLGEVKMPAYTDTDMKGIANKKVWYGIRALGPVREGEALITEVAPGHTD